MALWQNFRKMLHWGDEKYRPSVPRLHGVNLNVWRYIGYSIISFTRKGVPYKTTTVFFFCLNNDLSVRKYIIPPGTSDEWHLHSFITNTCELWKNNELSLHNPILDGPSKWLSKYMIDTYNKIWQNDEWVISNNVGNNNDTNIVAFDSIRSNKTD